MFRLTLTALCLLFNVLAASPRLHLAGDSTLCNYPVDPPNPQHGWGQELPAFFIDGFVILNHAAGGQSTASFLREQRWERLLKQVNAGDYVLLQFGHNDQKREVANRFADANTTYADNLRRMVSEIRERGGFALIATSVVRRQWKEGRFVDSLGAYPDAARRVAAETGTPLLELHSLSKQLLEAHGPEGSKRIYLWVPANALVRQPTGWRDNSHFSAYGARRVAALAVQELIRLDHPLTERLDSHTTP